MVKTEFVLCDAIDDGERRPSTLENTAIARGPGEIGLAVCIIQR